MGGRARIWARRFGGQAAPPAARLRPSLSHAAACAAMLVVVDLVKAHRGTYWDGGDMWAWAGAGAAFLLMNATIAAAGMVLRMVASLRLAPSCFKQPAGTVPLAAIAVWVCIVALADPTALTGEGSIMALATGAGCCALYGFIAMFTLALRRGYAAWPAPAALIGAALGVAALAATDAALFLHPSRPNAVAMAALLPFLVLLLGTFVIAFRPRRSGGALALAALALVAVGGYTGQRVWSQLHQEPGEPAAHNGASIVLITTDAQRADWCAPYGGPVSTPSLSALSERGVLFERAYSLAPWTLPSMYAMFASDYPASLTPAAGFEQWKDEMALYAFQPEAPTLAELLRAKGYATAAFVANALMAKDGSAGMLRGFETSGVWGHRTPMRFGPFEHTPLIQDALVHLGMPVVTERPADTARVLTRKAEAFLARQVQHETARPFFLWLHYMDPHGAYAPPPPFTPPGPGWDVYCNADPYWDTPLTDDRGVLDVTKRQRERIIALYKGEIRYVDYRIGQVLTALDVHQQELRTVVCYTSDHGEEFWDHGAYGHGHSLHEELIRVPMALAGPGIIQGRESGPVSHVDLMPTLADLAGVEAPATWKGTSLRPVLEGGQATGGPVFAAGTNLYSPEGPLEAIITRDWKAVRPIGHRPTLFRHGRSGMSTAQAEPNLNVVSTLLESLDAWASTHRTLAATTGVELSGEVEEKLRAFGYIR